MKKNKHTISKYIIILLIFILLSLTVYNLYILYKNIDITNEYEYQAKKTSFSTDNQNTVDNFSKNNLNTADMLENATQNVVGISKLSTTGGSILNNVSSEELGLGTGIIVSENGYILSNSHVTGSKYSSCYITVDENTYKGIVVWEDQTLDLSIVKVQTSFLNSAKLGDSSNLRVGDKTYAIGNPIGYEFRKTVTSGIISALNRTIKIDENFDTSYVSNLIQTDATINPRK